MRLFAALPIADGARVSIQRALGAIQARPEGWRWTDPAGWHVTLAFLGDVDEDEVPSVAAALRAAVSPSPPTIGLHTGAAEVRGRRLLWLPLIDEPRGAVADLGGRFQVLLEERGLPVDRKPVRAHLTLARARGRGRAVGPRHGEGSKRPGGVGEAQGTGVADPAGPVGRPESPSPLPAPAATWTVDRAVLYRSILGDGPATYEPLAWARLGEAGDPAAP